MGEINREKRALCLWLTLSLVWMCVIYAFSALNSTDSASMSGSLLAKLLALIDPRWNQLSSARQTAIMHMLHRGFRKCGHFSEYGVLGALLTASVHFICKSRPLFPRAEILLPALLSLLYAFTDELHQRFVAGRSGELRDVCIDLAGACCGCLLMNGAISLYHRRLRRKQLLHTKQSA